MLGGCFSPASGFGGESGQEGALEAAATLMLCAECVGEGGCSVLTPSSPQGSHPGVGGPLWEVTWHSSCGRCGEMAPSAACSKLRLAKEVWEERCCGQRCLGPFPARQKGERPVFGISAVLVWGCCAPPSWCGLPLPGDGRCCSPSDAFTLMRGTLSVYHGLFSALRLASRHRDCRFPASESYFPEAWRPCGVGVRQDKRKHPQASA